MSAIPEALKPITPYVRRAGEVEKTGDPRAEIVAYFCRTYAMESGLKISSTGGRSAEVQNFLLNLMQMLEKAKSANPELGEIQQCGEVVRSFAAEKMTEAEEEYMDGRANKNTARRFYAAASFFEVLATFNDSKQLDEATKKQVLFAKWRATQILKAIKEGRPPVPTDEELEQAGKGNGAADSDDLDIPLPPTAPVGAPSPRGGASRLASDDSDSEDDKPPARSPAKRSSKRGSARRHASEDSGRGDGGVSETQKADAMEYARFALRAIETDDIIMAKKHLESALRELEA